MLLQKTKTIDFILNCGSILLRLYVGFMFIVFMAYLQGLRRENPLANGEQNDLELGDAVHVIWLFFPLSIYTLQLFDIMHN